MIGIFGAGRWRSWSVVPLPGKRRCEYGTARMVLCLCAAWLIVFLPEKATGAACEAATRQIGSKSGDDPDDLVKRLLEMQAEFDNRLAQLEGYRVKVHSTLRDNGEAWVKLSTFALNRLHGCRMSIFRYEGVPPPRMLVLGWCFNSTYCFELEQPKGSDSLRPTRYHIDPALGLRMASVGFRDADEFSRPGADAPFHYRPWELPLPTGGFHPFCEQVQSPRFRVDREIVDQSSGNFLLDYRFSRATNDAVRDSSVHAEFDSIAGFPVKYVESHKDSSGAVWTLKHEYDWNIRQGLPVRMERRSEYSFLDAAGRENPAGSEMTVMEFEFGAIPEREFTLSAFGFPEPAELKGPAWMMPRWVWLTVIGVACLVAAAWLRSRRNGGN